MTSHIERVPSGGVACSCIPWPPLPILVRVPAPVGIRERWETLSPRRHGQRLDHGGAKIARCAAGAGVAARIVEAPQARRADAVLADSSAVGQPGISAQPFLRF